MIKPCKTLLIKNTIDLENVQRSKKKDNEEVTGHQVSSN
jgi:hypothetical protein